MDIVFAQDPGRPDLRLVEIQDGDGRSIQAGTWIPRPDGSLVLRLPDIPPAKVPADTATTRIHEMASHYLKQVPGARDAYDSDAGYHFELKLLIRMLGLVDQAMQLEDVPEETRIRVARTVMYGGPDEDAANTRIEQHRLQVEQLRNGLPVTPSRVLGWSDST